MPIYQPMSSQVILAPWYIISDSIISTNFGSMPFNFSFDSSSAVESTQGRKHAVSCKYNANDWQTGPEMGRSPSDEAVELDGPRPASVLRRRDGTLFCVHLYYCHVVVENIDPISPPSCSLPPTRRVGVYRATVHKPLVFVPSHHQ